MLRPLTFASVDDIAHAQARGRLQRGAVQHRWKAEDVGPIAELIALCRNGSVPAWLLDEHVEFGDLLWIVDAIASRRTRFTSSLGVIPAMSALPEELFAFMRHASTCAKNAGFPTSDADRLASALGELRGNIEDHSENSTSGFLVYAGSPGRFEISAVDQGIGVLASLRSCDEHAHISNDGDALRLAISDGGSRYGSSSNHGHGFRPIFVGLANHSGHLRFRSGGYALEIDGKDPKNMPMTMAQKPTLLGLTISVACRP